MVFAVATGMRHALDWFFRNRITGEITIAQAPNVPLLLFGACAATQAILKPEGRLGQALPVIAGGALAVWGLDEMFRGVNPWRRSLGGGVLVAQTYATMT